MINGRKEVAKRATWRRCGLVAIAAGAICLVGAVRADVPDLLDTLHHNGVLTDLQYMQLKQQEREGRKPPEDGRSSPQVAKTPPPVAAPKAAGSTFQVPEIDGYLQFDIPLQVGDATRFGSRTNLRRLYLRARERIARDWKLVAELGFFDGQPYVNEAAVAYDGLKLGSHPLTLGFGYFKPPSSVTHQTSPRDLMFPEWPLPAQVLELSESIGGYATTHGDRWSVAGAVIGGRYSQKADPGVEGRWGESVRFTVLPWLADDSLWQLGASAEWRAADSNRQFTFGLQPESRVIGTRFADTGAILHASWFATVGAESLMQYRAATLEAQYLQANVNRQGAPHLLFPGWSVQGSWVVTGERRELDRARGQIGAFKVARPISSGGWGAWEVGARYSALDLNSGDVSGGFERTATLGINWYPEQALKFMLDAIRILPLRGGPQDGRSSTVVMMRLQAAY